MGRVKIGLDLDGVVYNWDAQVAKMVRERFGTELDISSYWDHKRDVLPREQWRWLWQPKQMEAMFYQGAAYPGALQGAAALYELGALDILTSGPAASYGPKKRWLADREVQFLGFVLDKQGWEKSSQGCDLYIDDAPHAAADIELNTSATIILVDRPWNQHVPTSDRVLRARGWKQVVRLAEAFVEGEKEEDDEEDA